MSAEIAPEAVDAGTPSKERHSLTLDQRRALRRWASSQPMRPSHKACIDWFHAQYSQTISQSTVSHSLSPKYARLDGDTHLSGSRLRFGNWPDVEKLVLLWHQQMVNSGRHPSNEELAEKAKNIFIQLPRYKDESPPEFSPGWIHRFKKRYGLLIRRQRRHGTVQNAADDIPYLIDAVPRFMNITPDVSPAAIRDAVQRVVGVEASLAICARVRDEIVRRIDNPQPSTPQQQLQQQHPGAHPPTGDTPMYTEEDPEVVLQNALRALQQEEADAEAEAAAEREVREAQAAAERDVREAQAAVHRETRDVRDRSDQSVPPLGAIAGQAYAQHAAAAVNAISNPANSISTPANAISTPVHTVSTPLNAISTPVSAARASVGPPPSGSTGLAAPRFMPPTPQPAGAADSANGEDLTLTPIPSSGPVSVADRHIRCPFCINQRMLRSIKEAVEHMSTHVIVE